MTPGRRRWSLFSSRQDAVGAVQFNPNPVQNILRGVRQVSDGSNVTVGQIVRTAGLLVRDGMLLAFGLGGFGLAIFPIVKLASA